MAEHRRGGVVGSRWERIFLAVFLSAGASAAFPLQMLGLCWGLRTTVGCGNQPVSRNRVFISLLRKIDSFQNLKKKKKRRV